MGERYEVLDPRAIAASAPYTYFLPDPELVRAVDAGDFVKGMFRSVPPSETYDAERMWVQVTSAENDWLEGILDSDPADMPYLPRGSVVRLPRTHAIDWFFPTPMKRHLPHVAPDENIGSAVWLIGAYSTGSSRSDTFTVKSLI